MNELLLLQILAPFVPLLIGFVVYEEMRNAASCEFYDPEVGRHYRVFHTFQGSRFEFLHQEIVFWED